MSGYKFGMLTNTYSEQFGSDLAESDKMRAIIDY
jgi:hypothetical protein